MLDPQEPCILIYYNIRGKGQVIRNLLCYLQAKFVELHMELIEAGTEHPQEEVLEMLRNKPIDKSRLPLLVDGSEFVYGTLEISMHLCKAYKRTDLFGKNKRQRAQVFRILQKLLENQMKCQAFLLQFAETCNSKTDREIRQLTHLTYQKVMNSSQYIRQICETLQIQPKNRFICGNTTIVDFYFLQSCFYLLGIFGTIDKEYNRTFQSFYNSVVSADLKKKPNKMYLEQMRSFMTRMTRKAFYRKNRDYLESYSLIFHLMGQQRREGLKKIWVGQLCYVH